MTSLKIAEINIVQAILAFSRLPSLKTPGQTTVRQGSLYHRTASSFPPTKSPTLSHTCCTWCRWCEEKSTVNPLRPAQFCYQLEECLHAGGVDTQRRLIEDDHFRIL
ncbi:MAG: hypothetical protein MZV63_32945 [Marinilabiliales bacterium]|nr:hypothetical protein [Marinilabiliales bacterium]